MSFISIGDEVHETVEKTCRRSGWNKDVVLLRLGIPRSTYYGWFGRQQMVDARRCHSILPEEIKAVLGYVNAHPELHHKEMAYRMIDDNVAFLSPSSVYLILDAEGLIPKWEVKENLHKKELAKSTTPNLK